VNIFNDLQPNVE